MSFIRAFKQPGQRPPQSAHIGNPATTPNPLRLGDQLRFRQVERLLEQALKELEEAKLRIGRLENTILEQQEGFTAAGESSSEQSSVPAILSLPADEIKQLAEMAKRFK